MNIVLITLNNFVAMVMTFLSVFSFRPGPVSYAPLDEAGLRLNFSVIADTHIDNAINGTRVPVLADGLKDMANAAVKNDALVIAGDMTEGGLLPEYWKLAATLKGFPCADTILPVAGNHDIWGARGLFTGTILTPYEYTSAKYLNFLQNTAGIETDTIYFYRVINGCYFIVLNSEAMDPETYLSQTQLQWLDDLLAQAVPAGKPVFVVCHHPLASIGDEADSFYAVMKKYDGILDIFFMTGHWHTPFGESSIVSDGTVRFVALPSYGKGWGAEHLDPGTGYQVELYDDEIVFRARDFAAGKWLSEYDRTISLTNASY